MRRTGLVVVLTLLVATGGGRVGLWADQHPELWTIPDIVFEALSGEAAKAHVIEISRFYREDATPGFHEAALYIAGAARQAGLRDVHIETFPVDGKIRHFNLTTRFGWAPRRGELWLADPRLKLADFKEISTHLATWSTPADVEAELVDVGAGRASDFEGKDVRGKIAFTSSPPADIQAEAVGRRGAIGIVSYWSPITRLTFPDQVQWLDTNNNRLAEKCFAFVLSRRQGLALKDRLVKGPVKVHALVDAVLGPGQLEVVSAVIPGRELPDEEICLVAHICHFRPSSNDNASGCGLLLELARVWQDLIARGAIAAPRRTIRFLWVPENHGMVAYAEAHPEMSAKVKAALDLDMVGEDLDRANAIFRIIRTPESRPSFLNDVAEHFLQLVAEREVAAPSGTRSRFRYSVDPYTGGSDHAWLNDAGVGVPALLFTHWPDNFYHSSEDSPDKVDPTEMKRVGLIAFGAMRLLADARGADVDRLAERVASGGRTRIAQESSRALTQALDEPQAERARARLRSLLNLERDSVVSSAALDPSRREAIARIADGLFADERAAIDRTIARLPVPRRAAIMEGSALVPRRTGRYLSATWRNNVTDRLDPQSAERTITLLERLPQGDPSASELFNLFDGRRTLEDIAQILETQRFSEYMFNEYFGDGSLQPPHPYRGPRTNREELAELVVLLEKAGLVTTRASRLP
ncbi:MAG: DUF4910 domain-containing protein [Acidobacteria bacterium]|nr:DUF4910 domain-containing protein [Acidobacteriota bacterium]